MAIPEKPTISLRDVAESIAGGSDTADKIIALVSKVRGPAVNGEYIHWDKLRHLKPPPNLTSEAWWGAIKFFRSGMMKPIELTDTRGAPFVFTLPDEVQDLNRFIDTNTAGSLESTRPLREERSSMSYMIKSLVEEAITSSQLEGATMTRVAAQKMLRERRRPRNTSEQMIFNNYLTMERIHDLKDEPLTKEMVFELHRLITENTLDSPDQAGRFRTSAPEERNYVIDVNTGERLHEPPPAEELESRMKKMCAFANGEPADIYVHPAMRAIILHFWLAYDHPFVDGNGRCARALFYWSMLKSGYWLFKYMSISRHIKKAPAKYRLSFLYTETDDNDLTYFVIYHLKLLKTVTTEFTKYLQRRMKKKDFLLRQLSGLDELNHRQKELLTHALHHANFKYTVKSHMNSHRVTRQTALSDLHDLSEKGYLHRAKEGRRLVFTSTSDFESRLSRS